MRNMDWRIEHFAGDTRTMVTEHHGEHSRDMELSVIADLRHTAIVTPISDRAKAAWAAGWRPPVEVAR